MEELETLVTDWLAKMMGLPSRSHFLFESPKEVAASSDGEGGGGCLTSSSSEAVLNCLLAARAVAIKRLQAERPEEPPVAHLGRLVAYCSTESHSCVEKAAMVAFVRLRILKPAAEDLSMTGDIIEKVLYTELWYQ